jgi:hypothetical protein
MIIGNNNVFEVGSRMYLINVLYSKHWIYLVCEALKIGDNNILECKGIQRFPFD